MVIDKREGKDLEVYVVVLLNRFHLFLGSNDSFKNITFFKLLLPSYRKEIKAHLCHSNQYISSMVTAY